jgi:hypothetical protein
MPFGWGCVVLGVAQLTAQHPTHCHQPLLGQQDHGSTDAQQTIHAPMWVAEDGIPDAQGVGECKFL